MRSITCKWLGALGLLAALATNPARADVFVYSIDGTVGSAGGSISGTWTIDGSAGDALLNDTTTAISINYVSADSSVNESWNLSDLYSDYIGDPTDDFDNTLGANILTPQNTGDFIVYVNGNYEGVAFNFSDPTDGTWAAGENYDAGLNDFGNFTLTLQSNPSTVPLPTSLWMGTSCLAALGILGIHRRRQRLARNSRAII